MAEPRKYDVALSFAGEQRDQARELANQLQEAGYTPFFDEFEQSQLWGQDLPIKLTEIYENESRFCVAFLSAAYVEKTWTNHELRAAISRAAMERGEYLLPLRFDDAEVPGLRKGIAYLDMRKVAMAEVFELLGQKLGPAKGGVEGATQILSVRVDPDDSLLIVIEKDKPTRPVLNMECHLVNEGAKPATVYGLALHLEDPFGLAFQLESNLFYGGQRVQFKTSDPGPVSLLPGDHRKVGIQFVGPASISEYHWAAGRYELALRSWVDRQPEDGEPNLLTPFEIEISSNDADWVKHWAAAMEAEWRRLADPDNAVGVPIRIETAER